MSMTNNGVEILLVEDNPRDVEMTLRALKKRNLANNVHVAKDGAEALDFLFAKDAPGLGGRQAKARRGIQRSGDGGLFRIFSYSHLVDPRTFDFGHGVQIVSR